MRKINFFLWDQVPWFHDQIGILPNPGVWGKETDIARTPLLFSFLWVIKMIAETLQSADLLGALN